MGALKNLLNSEKGLVGLVLIVGATVLAGVGKVSYAEWQEYTLWVFGVYVSGKTVQGAVTAVTEQRKKSGGRS